MNEPNRPMKAHLNIGIAYIIAFVSMSVQWVRFPLSLNLDRIISWNCVLKDRPLYKVIEKPSRSSCIPKNVGKRLGIGEPSQE